MGSRETWKNWVTISSAGTRNQYLTLGWKAKPFAVSCLSNGKPILIIHFMAGGQAIRMERIMKGIYLL
jgi:hypothetical protein